MNYDSRSTMNVISDTGSIPVCSIITIVDKSGKECKHYAQFYKY